MKRIYAYFQYKRKEDESLHILLELLGTIVFITVLFMSILWIALYVSLFWVKLFQINLDTFESQVRASMKDVTPPKFYYYYDQLSQWNFDIFNQIRLILGILQFFIGAYVSKFIMHKCISFFIKKGEPIQETIFNDYY